MTGPLATRRQRPRRRITPLLATLGGPYRSALHEDQERCVRRHVRWCAACFTAALITIPGSLFAQTAEQKQPPAPAAKPPVVNRLNEVLPSWLRVRGEFRERMEGFENSGFTRTRDDVYWLTRVRLNATVMASKALSFQVQAQDARVAMPPLGAVPVTSHPGATFLTA